MDLDLGLSMEEAFQMGPESAVDTSKLDAMIRELSQRWEEVEKIKERHDAVKAVYDELEEKVISTLKAVQKDEYYVKGLGTFKVHKDAKVSLPNSIESMRAFKAYVAETGGEMAAEGLFSVNSNKLNAWWKKEMEARPGAAVPGISTPFERFSIRFPTAAQQRKEQGG